MKPSTLIQSPFTKAMMAKARTKLGNAAETITTRLSAATRSRKSHITHVKNASAVGCKLDSQYAIMEKESEIRTGKKC
jgi:hypothetical protein